MLHELSKKSWADTFEVVLVIAAITVTCNSTSSYRVLWLRNVVRILLLNIVHATIIFTARAYARAVLGVVILSLSPSVRPSVCLSHACNVTKLNDALQIFYTTRKGNHSATLIPYPLKSALKVTHPFEKRRLRPISTHNVSTVGDSEKSSITTNIKSTTCFSASHRWSAYVTTKCPKGWLKERFFTFWV